MILLPHLMLHQPALVSPPLATCSSSRLLTVPPPRFFLFFGAKILISFSPFPTQIFSSFQCLQNPSLFLALWRENPSFYFSLSHPDFFPFRFWCPNKNRSLGIFLPKASTLAICITHFRAQHRLVPLQCVR